MTKQTSSEAITLFVDRLVEEKKFESVDPEVLEQIRSDLMERVEDRINATILENMPKEKLEEFSALLDSANPEEVQIFCRNNIANLDEVIAEALVSFRSTYLNA
jgi:DNA-directed RNA polymerase subunit F